MEEIPQKYFIGSILQCCVEQRFTILEHNYVLRDRCWTKKKKITRNRHLLTEENFHDINIRLEASPKPLRLLAFE